MKKNGFTIVELVIVIAVIAILAAVLIPTFSSVIDKANKVSEEAFLKEVVIGLQIVLADHSEIRDLRLLVTDGHLDLMITPFDASKNEQIKAELKDFVAFDEKELSYYDEERLADAIKFDRESGSFSLNFDS